MNRITVVDTVYHQTTDTPNPTVLMTRLCRPVVTEEQIYTRHLKLTTEWSEIDTGWVKIPIMVIIQNNHDQPPVSGATSEQTLVDVYSAVEIGVMAQDRVVTSLCLVIPGDSLRLTHPQVSNLRIRAKYFPVRITVSAIPK